MEILDKYNIKPMAILKIAGITLAALIFLTFAFNLISSTFNRNFKNVKSESIFSGMNYENDMSFAGSDKSFQAMDSISLSSRNVSPSSAPINNNINTGNSEAFEVTQYNGSIETNNLDETCQAISSLKPKNYVIFENANENDNSCNYTFKVEKEYQDEVVDLVESLNPKKLVENTHTIKKLVDDFTSEIEILNRKKASIESTLEDAINSYDEISKVATQARDAESLSRIIDSKIKIIEKLSQERINVSTQLDRIGKAKAEQLDRFEYTYFYLNIYKNKFIDSEILKDSWKNEIKTFIREINNIAQDSSVGLITLIFFIIQYALYLLVIIITAKLGWKITKYIWKR